MAGNLERTKIWVNFTKAFQIKHISRMREKVICHKQKHHIATC